MATNSLIDANFHRSAVTAAPKNRVRRGARLGQIVAKRPNRQVNALATRAVASSGRLCHNAALSPTGCQGCRGGEKSSIPSTRSRLYASRAHPGRAGPLAPRRADEESKMPKLKTKSGAKKRFKITATGKVKYQQAGKRHGMIKRTTKQIREHRGTSVLFKTDGDNIKKYFLPNG
jgi:large subunit ribosomal protein L35